MKLRFIAILLCLAPVATHLCVAQNSPKTIICDLVGTGQPEENGCTHQYVNGDVYKTASIDGLLVTVGIEQDSKYKYMRAIIGISNNGSKAVDVIPSDFAIEVSTPHSKTLHYVPAEKIAKSKEKQTGRTNRSRRILGGFANALSAAAGSSQQQSTTQTTSSGTISAHSSDGTYTNGAYNGASTSTTSSPDTAAQQRAAEQIRQRNANIAASNAQRNAAASAESARLMQTALSANTILQGRAIGGVVYFEGEKKARIIALRIPIGDKLYEFKFDFE